MNTIEKYTTNIDQQYDCLIICLQTISFLETLLVT